MVDRCERWHLQDGQRDNRPSECDFRRERQGLGCRFKRETRWNLGVYDRPAQNSRRPGISEKARGNLPLEFRFCGDSDVGSRIRLLGLISAEEVEITFERD